MNAKHTPGPWAWFGDPKHGGFYLATVKHTRTYVMDLVRHGMYGVQPRFQKDGIMENASDICTFEVCESIGIRDAEKNEHCYRYDIDGIDHPDARLIAAAPDLLEALEDLVSDIDLHLNWAKLNGKTNSELRRIIKSARAALVKAKGETV